MGHLQTGLYGSGRVNELQYAIYTGVCQGPWQPMWARSPRDDLKSGTSAGLRSSPLRPRPEQTSGNSRPSGLEPLPRYTFGGKPGSRSWSGVHGRLAGGSSRPRARFRGREGDGVAPGATTPLRILQTCSQVRRLVAVIHHVTRSGFGRPHPHVHPRPFASIPRSWSRLRRVLRLSPSTSAARIWLPLVAARVSWKRGRSMSARTRS